MPTNARITAKIIASAEIPIFAGILIFSCDDGGVKNDDLRSDDLKNGNDASRRCDGVRSDDARLNDDDCLMSDDVHLMSCTPNDEFRFRFSE